MERAESSGTEPCGRSFRVSQRGGLPGTRRQRETGDALCQLLVAERDQDGEAVQSRPVKVAESRRQCGIVVLRR